MCGNMAYWPGPKQEEPPKTDEELYRMKQEREKV